ncbi:MAG: hypothetical protein LC799_24455 [Actinobacteria bacterium]|nr:hypothetical protein [Actinomycetota bacterium]
MAQVEGVVITSASGRRCPHEHLEVVGQPCRPDLPSKADRLVRHPVRGVLFAFQVEQGSE